MFKDILSPALLVLAAATPASALDVSRSTDVAAPPEKVWQVVGTFCGIGDWHPAVEKCTLSDQGGKHMRTISLKGGGTILEEELSRDDAKMDYSYAIVESPLPVADYKSTLQVVASGAGSRLTWSGTFKAKGADDAKAQEVIAGIYDAGLKGIADKAK